jgi:hypothetical protein
VTECETCVPGQLHLHFVSAYRSARLALRSVRSGSQRNRSEMCERIASVGRWSGAAAGKPVQEFNVPELVDRACLPQDASLMGVGEKAHQRPWQPVA